VTVSPTEAPTGAPYPAWDPPPRPPRRIASWLALALAGVAGIVAAVGVGSVFGARYAVRADICSTVDLGPVGAALDRPDLTAVAANSPDAENQAPGRPELLCRFTVAHPDGSPRAAGKVTATWYDNAFIGRLQYEIRRDQAAGSIHERIRVTDLTGLGERAFSYHADDAGSARFRVATLDSNLYLDLQVAVYPGDRTRPAGQVEPPVTALTDAIRSSLIRLR
jgi:hypothetical protein